MADMPTTAGTVPRRRVGVSSEHESYKWWALSCTGLGMLLATINSGTLIIALPDLERALGTSILELVWVILAYMIASTVLVLTAGRLSDLFGRKHAYVGGFVVFALASLGAGFAGSGTELILWRILQGIGGAFLFANAAALVTDAFPKEQLGLAMGTNTMIAAVGLVIGPVLGGALVSISWHWVFWFNVPLGLAGGAWGWAVLHELARRDTQRGYDLLGTATFVTGLTGLVLGISKGGITGWDDPVVIGGLIAAVSRCSTSRSSRTASSPPRPPPRSSTACRASRCSSSSSSTTRAPRATTRSPPASSSRRWRSACSSPRRWPACTPIAAARGCSPRSACSSRRSRSRR
jgi:MFS family permease